MSDVTIEDRGDFIQLTYSYRIPKLELSLIRPTNHNFVVECHGDSAKEEVEAAVRSILVEHGRT